MARFEILSGSAGKVLKRFHFSEIKLHCICGVSFLISSGSVEFIAMQFFYVGQVLLKRAASKVNFLRFPFGGIGPIVHVFGFIVIKIFISNRFLAIKIGSI